MANAEQKKTSTRTIIILLLVLNMLAVGAIAGYFVFLKPAVGEPKQPEMATTELGKMLVNLDGNGSHFIRFTAVMEYPKNEKKLVEELTKKDYIIKHTAIKLLRSKRLADVQTPDSIDKVQREMTDAINKHLQHGQITKIYFTEYLTQ